VIAAIARVQRHISVRGGGFTYGYWYVSGLKWPFACKHKQDMAALGAIARVHKHHSRGGQAFAQLYFSSHILAL